MKVKPKFMFLASVATAVLASRGAAGAPRPTHVACVGDANVYGRVYMATVGRGIVYGKPTP